MGGSSSTETTTVDQTQTEEQRNQATQATGTSTQNATSSFEQFLNSFQNTFGTQQTGTQDETQTTTLPSFQQPVVQQFFQELAGAFQNGSLNPDVFTGDRVAGPTDTQLAGRDLTTNFATGAGTDFANQALLTNSQLLDPSFLLNPENIPGLQASRTGIVDSLTQNLTEQILPGVRGEALLNNAFGGSRQGIAEGQAIGRTQTAIGSALAELDLGVFSEGLRAQQNALALAPQTAGLGAAAGETLQTVGGAERADDQAIIDAEREQFGEEQASPAVGLSILQSLMGISGDFGGTTTGTGVSTGTSAGTEAGTQESTQIANTLANMLGISVTEIESFMSGIQNLTGTTTTETENTPSFLQNLSAIASIFLLPSTFGASAVLPDIATEVFA